MRIRPRRSLRSDDASWSLPLCVSPSDVWIRLLSRGALLRSKHAVGGPVSHHQLTQHPHVLRRVFGVKAFDGDVDALLDDVRLEPVTNHPARRPGFEGPPLDLAAVVLHVEKEP